MKYDFLEEDGTTSHIQYVPNFMSNEQQTDYLSWLNNMDDFKGGTTYFGTIPRQQKWYQMEGKSFGQHWKNDFDRWKSHSYDTTLLELQDRISSIFEQPFNSVLCNKYTDGSKSIKLHKDDQITFGSSPTIVNLSLGSARRIRFVRTQPNSMKFDRTNPMDFTIQLESGSILIMSGSVQKYFAHEVAKTKDDVGVRYSLTFRKYIL